MKRMQGDALLQAAERAYGGDVASDEDSSDEDEAPARAPLNAFALLGGDDDNEDEEAEDDDEEEEEVRTAATIPRTTHPRRDLFGHPPTPRDLTPPPRPSPPHPS